MSTVLITGANRGLGFGLAEQFVKQGWSVIGTTRNPAKAEALNALAAKSGKVRVEALDVTDEAAIAALKAKIGDEPIDVLLNVAGIFGKHDFNAEGVKAQSFGNAALDEWQAVFKTNLFAPMKIAETFIENVASSSRKTIVTLSSELGSIGGIRKGGGLYPYRISKAGVNMMMKAMSVDLAARGVIAIPMHPGWVRTDMGGPNADIDVETSTGGMVKVVLELKASDSGRYLAYDGSELPW
jgi:NAD(P)-dependent dehydrogenase (short-subunit alcohol dehydrogenase family)